MLEANKLSRTRPHLDPNTFSDSFAVARQLDDDIPQLYLRSSRTPPKYRREGVWEDVAFVPA